MVAVTLCLSPALGADVQNGEVLARRWCAACHVVAPNQHQPTSEATPFREIAKKPDFDSAKLALFLLNPHPVMPNVGLSRGQAADLAAYIETLK
jgi:mono/diheme cytochrome c family protein